MTFRPQQYVPTYAVQNPVQTAQVYDPNQQNVIYISNPAAFGNVSQYAVQQAYIPQPMPGYAVHMVQGKSGLPVYQDQLVMMPQVSDPYSSIVPARQPQPITTILPNSLQPQYIAQPPQPQLAQPISQFPVQPLPQESQLISQRIQRKSKIAIQPPISPIQLQKIPPGPIISAPISDSQIPSAHITPQLVAPPYPSSQIIPSSIQPTPISPPQIISNPISTASLQPSQISTTQMTAAPISSAQIQQPILSAETKNTQKEGQNIPDLQDPPGIFNTIARGNIPSIIFDQKI